MTSRTHFKWNCIKNNEQKADMKWLWRHMVVTRIATMKKQKNQQKANNSPSYRGASFKKIMNYNVYCINLMLKVDWMWTFFEIDFQLQARFHIETWSNQKFRIEYELIELQKNYKNSKTQVNWSASWHIQTFFLPIFDYISIIFWLISCFSDQFLTSYCFFYSSLAKIVVFWTYCQQNFV